MFKRLLDLTILKKLESEALLLLNMNAVIGDDDTVYDVKNENWEQANKVVKLIWLLKGKNDGTI